MNILVLSSCYPHDDDKKNSGVTPVVFNFVKEWKRIGHNVIVIHNISRYPSFVRFLPKKLLNKAASKYGIIIENRLRRKILKSVKNDVACYRLPLLRIIPKKKYFNFQVEKQFGKISGILRKEAFIPEVVIGHWEDPQIPLLSMFKKKYGSKTALVFHEIVYIKQKRYKKWAMKFIKDIDVIGARSKTIANEIIRLLPIKKEPFICYSGIDEKYFLAPDISNNIIDNKIANSFLYVGRLIKRKNIDKTMIALSSFYENKVFIFNIVGEGVEKDKLVSIRDNLMLKDNVIFHGYKDRDKVLEIMSLSQTFIMISDNETFGLVYIEAMSRGCIVIASKNGGMDGIIRNGENGFLCKQGDADDLIKTLVILNSMTEEEKKKISLSAIETASNFTDFKVAKKYLDIVLQY